MPDVFVSLRADIKEFSAKLGEARDQMDLTQKKGESAFGSLGKFGVAAFSAVAASAVGLGVEAIHLADTFETSHARLTASLEANGTSFAAWTGQIGAADKAGQKLGFTNAQVQDGLARLQTMVKNPTVALKDLSVAEDIARARGLDLTDASNMVGKASEGTYTALVRLGVVTKEQAKHFQSGAQAVEYLAASFSGQAAAAADTFGGKMAVLKAQAENIGAAFGMWLIPKIESLASVLASTINWFERNKVVVEALAVAFVAVLVPAATVAAASMVAAFGATMLASIESYVAMIGNLAREMTALGLATDAAAGPVGWLVGAFTLLWTAMSKGANWNDITDAEKGWAQAFLADLGNVDDKVGALRKEHDALQTQIAGYQSQMDKLGGGTAYGKLADQQADLIKKQSLIDDALKKQIVQSQAASQAAGDLSALQLKQADATDQAAASVSFAAGRDALAAQMKKELTQAIADEKAALDDTIGVTQKQAQADLTWQSQLKAIIPVNTSVTDGIKAQQQALADATARLNDEKKSYDDVIGKATSLASANASLATTFLTLDGNLGMVQKTIAEVKTALDNLIGVHVGVAKADADWAQQLLNLQNQLTITSADYDKTTHQLTAAAQARLDQAASIDKYTGAINLSTQAGIDETQVLAGAATAIKADAQAMLDSGVAADKVNSITETHIQQLDDQLRKLGLTPAAIAAVNAEFGLTPKEVSTALSTTSTNRIKTDASGVDLGTTLGVAQSTAIGQAANAIKAQAQAMIDSGVSMDVVRSSVAANIAKLDDHLAKLGVLPKDIAAINAEFGLVPSKIAAALAENETITALNQTKTATKNLSDATATLNGNIGAAAQGIVIYGKMMMDAGAPTQNVADKMNYMVRQLDDQLRKLGLTPAAITAVNTQWGLTPKDINTALGINVSINSDAITQQLSTMDDYAAKGIQYLPVKGPFATGGMVTEGPALIGEGNPAWPEYVIPTDPAHRGNAKHLLTSLASRLGNGMAAGGLVGGLAAHFANFGSTAGTLAADLGIGNQNVIDTKMQKIVDQMSTQVFAAILNGLAGGTPAAVAQSGTFPGSLVSWVAQAIGLTGVSPAWQGPLDIIAMHESGGNPSSINLWDSNAAAGHPSQGLFQCVSMDTVILTRRGWLPYDEVVVGDETIGYNPVSGRSEWTLITQVVRFDNAPVWRIGHKGWHADVTPNHRWWSEPFIDRVERGTICPVCDSEWATERGMETHLGKAHHQQLSMVRTIGGEFVTTENLRKGDRIRLAAPADTDGIACLSMQDVAVIAWLQGDGHVRPVVAKPSVCPECGWVSRRRKPSRGGEVRQVGNSVAVHRAKVHAVGKGDTVATDDGGYDGTIYQSKPEMVVKLRALLADIPHTEVVRPTHAAHHFEPHVFRLRRAYVTDLIKRAALFDQTPEMFVLTLSPDQRTAWLGAMIDAEGNRQPGKKPGHSEFIRIAQVDGPLQDAIRLAVYLEGYRPTYSALSAERNGFQPCGQVGMAKPHVAPSTFHKPTVLVPQTVWCVKTVLETWTALLDGQVFLTGNTIPSTFAGNMLPGHGNILNPVDNAAAAIEYILRRYHDVWHVPGIASLARGGPYVGYDAGGLLKPGLTMAWNGTGKPETVTPAGAGGGGGTMQVADVYLDGQKVGYLLARHVRTSLLRDKRSLTSVGLG